jgi:hypothetical protein
MKTLGKEVNQYRIRKGRGASDDFDGNNGAFVLPGLPLGNCKRGPVLFVIISDGMGWEHVSVTVRDKRCPTWDEMDHIKRTFWNDDEVVMQLHVARKNHISHHDTCLHLWRPTNGEVIPLPHPLMVGIPNG